MATTLKPLPFLEAIEALRRRRVVLPAEFYQLAAGAARAQAFAVTGATSIAQAERVLELLVQAMMQGQTFEQWKAAVKAGDVALQLPAARLETIYRTNLQTGYGYGKFAQAKRHELTHPFLLYSAVNDSRTRPAHRAMHGTILPVGHPWWRTHTPPCGFNCRCTVISLTRREAERRGGVTANPPDVAADAGGFGTNPFEQPRANALGVLDSAVQNSSLSLRGAAATMRGQFPDGIRVNPGELPPTG